MKLNIGLLFYFLLVSRGALGQSFVHPGLLNSQADLERMRDGVAQKIEPVYSGYLVFAKDPQSRYDYKMQGPLKEISRNPTIGQAAYDADANAAYQNAIMWCITGKIAHARKAEEIINAWCGRLKSITGKDAVLMAGLGPFKMINAAEILRYTDAGWSEPDIKRAERHFQDVVYPVLKDFAPFANGNWDSAALKTVMAIAIFCNDREMFERALDYYVDGDGDGALNNYIISDSGQCQESGRDQSHTQLGIGHLGDCCEIAWHQGLNLYAYANNRLLKGFEYTAKYNLGYNVPYDPAMDKTGKYDHPEISAMGRGRLRPIYEQIYNHYVKLLGETAPFAQQAAEKLRPEPKGEPGADHLGFGTLLYSLPEFFKSENRAKLAAVRPGGLIARGNNRHIVLSWIATVGADRYKIKRAIKSSGPFVTIASPVTSLQFVDSHIKKGNIYYYKVVAECDSGQSAPSLPVRISAGLPKEWRNKNIANPLVNGDYSCDGNQLTLEVSRKDVGNNGVDDQFQYIRFPFTGDGTIVARLVPPFSSQQTQGGLLMTTKSSGRAGIEAALMIKPCSSSDIEMPVWNINFLTRLQGDQTLTSAAEHQIPEPYVRWGRLMKPVWLRLTRRGTRVFAESSLDGNSWTKIGSKEISLHRKAFAGIIGTSGVGNLSARIRFDHIKVSCRN